VAPWPGERCTCYILSIQEHNGGDHPSTHGLEDEICQLLYGENASGVLVETDTEDDIQREIIRDALKGKTFASIGEKINIFGTGKEHTTRITRAPEGSLIAASPTITIVELPEGDTMQLTLFLALNHSQQSRESVVISRHRKNS